ncbi:Alkaline phosphatase synthesis sensor protein PhoR [Lacunisphaera limnophila]|uniref:histidine kinase n=2 Tax=Lacunisphaera limnophila TaxID=1838286 RepID=A0A1D8ASU6_9BACT|nr:Alkaline phosphatase synthesis sensor protein PhoR [Lacunisphaera limnophila]
MVLLLVVLALALGFALRALLKQKRAHTELENAVRRGQPLLHEDGPASQLPGWHALTEEVNRLITENASLRQQHTDQLAQLEATLGNLREAVLIVDGANYIHLANRALREIFPGARDLINLRLELIVRSGPFLEYVRATRDGAPLARQEFEIIEGDNTLWIEASGAPIPSPDGKSQWALFVIHDMTNQRKLERMRRDFVANASHELRTPLSIIKGYVETLVDGHQTMEVADRDKFLRTIQRHSDRLKSIIDDLLTLSRLESATLGVKFASLDIAQYLEDLAEEYRRRPQATDHEIVVNFPGKLGPFEGDDEKLVHVFGNLVENALKYTPKGSRIELGATAAGADEVEFFVRDNGPGIPAADLPHIFERFYRVEKGRSRETGGTGLGLSIVKHIVQLHGGRVWAENRAEGGLVIFVRLPRQRKE